MYSKGTPEYMVYPGTPMDYYGYYYTGFQAPGEWDGHPHFLDGQEVQYMGGQMENFPFQHYYTPGYEYTQPLYNPYDSYASCAVVGSNFQQVYATPPQYDGYLQPASYYQSAVQPRSDMVMNYMPANMNNGTIPAKENSKQNLSSTSAPFTMGSTNPTTKLPHSVPEISKKSSFVPVQTIVNERGSNAAMQVGNNNVTSQHHDKQLKHNLPVAGGLPNHRPGAYQHVAASKINPAFYGGGHVKNVIIRSNMPSDQSLMHQVKKLDHQLFVKAYTTKAGLVNAEGSIIINPVSYNKADFPVDYVHAKFFVIKSYSEDDVHKSIKYNVWSSTPNGNKKLDRAFEDVQRIAGKDHQGCPVFLFFSVNASGNFCGVAEMAGRVDFNRDMDFWQQDKWSGSFPVKWHIIKDAPNVKFRHITLENNENNPVTYSRDTQEVMHKPGVEVLKIFKAHAARTSLLDDFLFYETREKIMHEGRIGQTSKRSDVPVLIPGLHQPPPRKLNYVVSVPAAGDVKMNYQNELKSVKQVDAQLGTYEVHSIVESPLTNITKSGVGEANIDPVGSLKIGLLTSSSEKPKTLPAPFLSSVSTPVPPIFEPEAMITVGTMPVKINGLKKSTGSKTSVTKAKDTTRTRKVG